MRSIELIQADIDQRETRLAELKAQLETDAESVDAGEVIRLDTEVNGFADELAQATTAAKALQRKERAQAAAEEPGSVGSMFKDLASDLVEISGGGERLGDTTFPVADLINGILEADVVTRTAGLPTGQVPVVAPVDVGRPTGLVDIIQILPTDSQTIQLPAITWENRAAVTGEGMPAPENAGVLNPTLTVTTKRVPVHMKVSVQALRDVEAMQAEIQTTLMADARQKLDRMIVGRLAADNADNGFPVAQTIWGATGTQQKGTAEAAGDKVATLFIEYMNAAGDYGYEPNYVVMSRRAWGGLVASTKDTDNDYLFRGREREVDGVPVVFTTAFDSTRKTMVGGVFNPRVITLRARQNPTISVGMDGTDMVDGLRTILLEMEIAQAIRGSKLLALYKDTSTGGATAWV